MILKVIITFGKVLLFLEFNFRYEKNLQNNDFASYVIDILEELVNLHNIYSAVPSIKINIKIQMHVKK